MDKKLKTYFDKILEEKETNELGTDFASPEDRQSAMIASLAGEMEGMMPESPQVPMKRDPEDLKEMVKEYVKLRQNPQGLQDGGLPLTDDELAQQQMDQLGLSRDPFTAPEIPEQEIIEDTINDVVEAQNAPKEKSFKDLSDEQKLKKLQDIRLNKMYETLEKEDRKIDAGDYLPDVFAGLHNVLNYAQGSQQKNIKLGSLDRARKEMQAQDKQKQDTMDRISKLLSAKDKDDKSSNKQYFNTSDGIVEVDKATGDTRLVREAELKKQREARLKDQFEFGKEVKGRLSDKEIKDITALDDGTRILNDIDDMLENTDVEKDLGPYASRVENLSDLVPGVEQDPDFVKMQQLVGIQLADYVKSISGAQVSEEEAQRLLKNIPNVGDKPKAFKIKLDTFRKELNEAKQNYLDNIGKQKESAKKFKEDKKEDPKIKEYAEQYNLDYSKAEKILRARGYNG